MPSKKIEFACVDSWAQRREMLYMDGYLIQGITDIYRVSQKIALLPLAEPAKALI